MRTKLTWVRAHNNPKTGPIPSAYVGRTPEEAWRSCEGCALREGACYAWQGWTGKHAVDKVMAGLWDNPLRHAVEWALAKLPRRARAVRIGVLGDPSAVGKTEWRHTVATVRARGLAVLSYTHHWREARAAHLRGEVLASCDDLAQAREARAAGWVPAAIVDAPAGARQVRDGGLRLVVCPAQRKPGRITCNDCRLCDARHPAWEAGVAHGVAFLPHGRGARRLPVAAGRRA